MTDIAKHASGADADISTEAFDPAGLMRRVAVANPRALAFNGKKAPSIFFGRPTVKIPYGLTPTFLGMPPIFVLPSTSRAANGSWNAQVW